MRTFTLQRDEDPTGVSGTGEVAEGVMWTDGRAAVHWIGDMASTIVYDSMDHVIQIHGHEGRTRVVFDDQASGQDLPW